MTQDCFFGGEGSGSGISQVGYCLVNPAFTSTVSGDGFSVEGAYYCADGARYTSSETGSGLSRSEVWYCDSLDQVYLFHSETVVSSGFTVAAAGFCQPLSFIGGLSGQIMSSVNYCTNITYMGSGASGMNTVMAVCQDPLPVELLSFIAVKSGNSALLLWKTASEINNNYFRIERSADGFDFGNLGIVFGAGNSNQLLEYSFLDATPVSGINYYRLVQVDFDGTEYASQIASLDFETSDDQIGISMYPNPVKTDNILNIVLPPDVQGHMRITDINGRILFSDEVENSQQPIQLKAASDLFNPGVYFISVVTGSSVYSGRFLVQ